MMADAVLDTDIRFERVTGTVGAIVHGVALDETSPAVAEQLNRALHEYGVLFFEYDHCLSAAEFLEFSKLFGEAEDSYKFTIDNGEAPYIDSDQVPMKDVRINYWHTDGTAMERPPQSAMLTPVELPEAGGDTMWCSMYAAWDALSPHYQRMLEGLEVQHSTARLPFLREQDVKAVHPAVIRDAVTGRKMLFVNANYSERIIGMSDSESEELLQMLFRHINTPEFHVRLRWRLGTVAVWEERVVQHRGVADFTGPRKLRRLTFKGDRPSA
jgi:taurine dioxygenase